MKTIHPNQDPQNNLKNANQLNEGEEISLGIVPKQEQIKDDFQARNIHFAKEKLDVLKLPPQERQQYNAYLEGLRYEQSMFEMNRKAYLIEGEQIGLEKGRQEGEQMGVAKGRREEKHEMARSMKADGEPLDKIRKYTGLSLTDLEKL